MRPADCVQPRPKSGGVIDSQWRAWRSGASNQAIAPPEALDNVLDVLVGRQHRLLILVEVFLPLRRLLTTRLRFRQLESFFAKRTGMEASAKVAASSFTNCITLSQNHKQGLRRPSNYMSHSSRDHRGWRRIRGSLESCRARGRIEGEGHMKGFGKSASSPRAWHQTLLLRSRQACCTG